MSSLSDRIRLGMKLRKMRQTDLAELTGISRGALSSYLSGRYAPKQHNLHLLAQALDVNEKWLMGDNVPIEPTDYNYQTEYIVENFTKIYCETKEESNLILTYRRIPDDMKLRVMNYLTKLSSIYDEEILLKIEKEDSY